MPTMPRAQWTDDRLDNLNEKVDEGFAQVDQRFAQVDERFQEADRRLLGVELELQAQRRDISNLRTDMNVRIGELTSRFERLDDHIAALNRILVVSALGLAFALIATRVPF